MADKRPTVNLSNDEYKAIEGAMERMNITDMSFSNLARAAIAKYLKINLEPMERGGIRAGGFEPGNRLASGNATKRWETAKKKKAAKK